MRLPGIKGTSGGSGMDKGVGVCYNVAGKFDDRVSSACVCWRMFRLSSRLQSLSIANPTSWAHPGLFRITAPEVYLNGRRWPNFLGDIEWPASFMSEI